MVKLIDGSEIFSTLMEINSEAFPPAERRSEEKFLRLMKLENFFLEGIEYEGKTYGMVAYWIFDDFIFIDYLAMHSSSRGSGLGTKFLSFFKEKFTGKQIILEIEHPETEIQKRRVCFYERNGFHYNDEIFVMPQISGNSNEEKVLLNIMSLPHILTKNEYDNVIKTLIENVYK